MLLPVNPEFCTS